MASSANAGFAENSKDVKELWAIRQGLKGEPGVAPKQKCDE